MRKMGGNIKKRGNKERKVGYCGSVCTECPAYIATQTDNNELLVKTAKEWAKEFGRTCTPEEILCDGCQSGSSRICSYVAKCEIRKCCKNKGLDSCAYCDEYACDQLKEFFVHLPEAKDTLSDIRKWRIQW